MPDRSRCRLEPGRIVAHHLDPKNRQAHIKPDARFFAESAPGIGVGAQAMIDMRGREREADSRAQARKNLEQYRRVDAATQSEAQAVVPGYACGLKYLADMRDKIRLRRLCP